MSQHSSGGSFSDVRLAPARRRSGGAGRRPGRAGGRSSCIPSRSGLALQTSAQPWPPVVWWRRARRCTRRRRGRRRRVGWPRRSQRSRKCGCESMCSRLGEARHLAMNSAGVSSHLDGPHSPGRRVEPSEVAPRPSSGLCRRGPDTGGQGAAGPLLHRSKRDLAAPRVGNRNLARGAIGHEAGHGRHYRGRDRRCTWRGVLDARARLDRRRLRRHRHQPALRLARGAAARAGRRRTRRERGDRRHLAAALGADPHRHAEVRRADPARRQPRRGRHAVADGAGAARARPAHRARSSCSASPAPRCSTATR